jgi:hypothetical protein
MMNYQLPEKSHNHRTLPKLKFLETTTGSQGPDKIFINKRFSTKIIVEAKKECKKVHKDNSYEIDTTI